MQLTKVGVRAKSDGFAKTSHLDAVRGNPIKKFGEYMSE